MKHVRFISTLLSVPFTSAAFAVIVPFLSPGLGSLSLYQVLLLDVLFLGIVPYIPYVVQMKKGLVDFDVTDRKKRNPTYLAAMLSYLVLLVVFITYSSPFMAGFAATYFIGTVAIFAVNLFWKVSAHTAGLTGPITFLLLAVSPFMAIFYLLVIAAAYTRIRLDMHTQLQLLAGSLITVVTAALSYALFL